MSCRGAGASAGAGAGHAACIGSQLTACARKSSEAHALQTASAEGMLRGSPRPSAHPYASLLRQSFEILSRSAAPHRSDAARAAGPALHERTAIAATPVAATSAGTPAARAGHAWIGNVLDEPLSSPRVRSPEHEHRDGHLVRVHERARPASRAPPREGTLRAKRDAWVPRFRGFGRGSRASSAPSAWVLWRSHDRARRKAAREAIKSHRCESAATGA